MGFNTTVVVLNDALHHIAADPDFGKKLADAISRLSTVPPGEQINVSAGNHCTAAYAVETHHADNTVLVAVGGNYATVIHSTYGWSHHEPPFKERVVKEMKSDIKAAAVKVAHG